MERGDVSGGGRQQETDEVVSSAVTYPDNKLQASLAEITESVCESCSSWYFHTASSPLLSSQPPGSVRGQAGRLVLGRHILCSVAGAGGGVWLWREEEDGGAGAASPRPLPLGDSTHTGPPELILTLMVS